MRTSNHHRRGSFKGFVVLFLMAVFVFLIFFLRAGLPFGKSDPVKIELEEVSRHVTSEPNEVRMVGAGLCVWNHKNIDFLDASGKSLNDRPVLLEKPIISYGKNHVYLFDENGKELYILNEKGDNTETFQTEQILSAAHELEDAVGYITRDTEGERLTISKWNGTELFKKEVLKKHFGVFTMSKDGTFFAYSTFYFSGGDIISSFIIENSEGKEYLRHGLSGDTVLSAKLFGDGRYCYLTKSGLYFGILSEEGTGVEKNVFSESFSTEERQNMSPIAIGYGETLGLLTAHNFYEISSEGEVLSVYPFVGKYHSLSPLRKGFLLSGESGVLILENGKMLLQKDEELLSASSNESMLVLQTPSEIQWYRMKYTKNRAQ